jgi:lysophospholipase L1-like esterase
VLACCFALSLFVAPCAEHASRQVNSVLLMPRKSDRPADPSGSRSRGDLVVVRTSLQACEARLERQPRRLPAVAIVGASYTAGVGPDNPQLSWAVELARLLHWNAVIYGVPGAGYANGGLGGHGPIARMLDDERLPGLAPDLVIVQAGRDDSGLRPSREEQRVRADLDLIRDRAPKARIALLTVFAGPQWSPPPYVHAINRAIVAAARSADPRAIIMNPLAGRWKYDRADGHDTLHPDAAGDAWIARKVLSILRGHGIEPAAATQTTPMICDVSIGVGQDVPA